MKVNFAYSTQHNISNAKSNQTTIKKPAKTLIKSGTVSINGHKVHINKNDIAKSINKQSKRTGVRAKNDGHGGIQLFSKKSVLNIKDNQSVLKQAYNQKQIGPNRNQVIQVKRASNNNATIGGKVKINYNIANAQVHAQNIAAHQHPLAEPTVQILNQYKEQPIAVNYAPIEHDEPRAIIANKNSNDSEAIIDHELIKFTPINRNQQPIADLKFNHINDVEPLQAYFPLEAFAVLENLNPEMREILEKVNPEALAQQCAEIEDGYGLFLRNMSPKELQEEFIMAQNGAIKNPIYSLAMLNIIKIAQEERSTTPINPQPGPADHNAPQIIPHNQDNRTNVNDALLNNQKPDDPYAHNRDKTPHYMNPTEASKGWQQEKYQGKEGDRKFKF